MQSFNEAHQLGNTDASINLALLLLSGKVAVDKEKAKKLLIRAYQEKNQKAGEILVIKGFVSSHAELAGLLLVELEADSNRMSIRKGAVESSMSVGASLKKTMSAVTTAKK